MKKDKILNLHFVKKLKFSYLRFATLSVLTMLLNRQPKRHFSSLQNGRAHILILIEFGLAEVDENR